MIRRAYTRIYYSVRSLNPTALSCFIQMNEAQLAPRRAEPRRADTQVCPASPTVLVSMQIHIPYPNFAVIRMLPLRVVTRYYE